MPLLTVKNLSVSLGGQKILENINFEVEEGESLAIIGPNGAGKTVLFRALLGFIPYEGEVKWFPVDSDGRFRIPRAKGEGGAFRMPKIGYVPQKIDFDRYLPLSLEDFLCAKANILNLPQKEIEKNLGAVGFSKSILKSNLGSLSFGQFQKALILFALIGEPGVLLLDEPTLGVDAPYETYIYEIVHRLQTERKLTILLISHEIEIVYRYTTKVLCLNKKMLCLGAPQEALTEKNLSELYKETTIYHHHHEGEV